MGAHGKLAVQQLIGVCRQPAVDQSRPVDSRRLPEFARSANRRPDFDNDRVAFEAVDSFQKSPARPGLGLPSASAPTTTSFDHFCREQSAWLDGLRPVSDAQGIARGRAVETCGRTTCATASRKRLKPFGVNRPMPSIGSSSSSSCFFSQWARPQGVCKIPGGSRSSAISPYYVNYDSSDTWSHPDIFKLNGLRRPAVVSRRTARLLQ